MGLLQTNDDFNGLLTLNQGQVPFGNPGNGQSTIYK